MPYKDVEQRKRKYNWRKEHHICVQCGKNQTIENRAYCFECAKKYKKYFKEEYEWLKQHHICVYCKQNIAEINHVYCYECSLKKSELNRERWKKQTEEQKDAIREYRRKRYNKIKEKGLCTRCGRSTNNNGKTLCNECLIKRRRYDKERNRRKGIVSQEERGNGTYCYRCCKPVETKGEKLCESCKKKASEHMSNIRFQYLEHHENPFRRLNNLSFGGNRK